MIIADTLLLENANTSAEWATSNPVLPARVLGYDTTVRHYKMGDGVTAWLDLPFWEAADTLPPVIIDVPIGTTGNPYFLQMNPDYLTYGNHPTIEVSEYVSGTPSLSPAVLHPFFFDGTKNYINGTLALVKINFQCGDDGKTLFRNMIVIKA